MSEKMEMHIQEEEKAVIGEAFIPHSFVDGASDSAQVVDIPEPEQLNKGVRDPEFIVGAAILSAVGGIFMLTALVLVWINYMNDFLKGMSMYLLAVLIVCVSELFIRRFWIKLSYVLSSVGIGGFYVATMVNCQWFRYFPEAVAMEIIAIFSALVLLYGWAKNVPWYRIEGLFTFYFCLAMIHMGLGNVMYFLLLTLGLSVGLLGALLPHKKQAAAVTVVSMLSLMLFFEIPLGNDVGMLGMIQEMVYCMAALLILNLLLLGELKFYCELGNEGTSVRLSLETGRILCFASYLVSLFFLYIHFCGAALRSSLYSPALQICLAGLIAVCLVSFVILHRYTEKWILYCFAEILAYTVYLTMELRSSEDGSWGGWCLGILLLLAQIIALRKSAVLRVNQAVLTAIAAITIVTVSDRTYVYFLAAVLFVGLAIANHWHVYYEILVTYVAARLASRDLPFMLSLPVFVGILFLGLLLVNNVKRLRERGSLIYNWVILSGQIISYLLLMMPIYRNSYLTIFCMLVFGLSIIVLILQEQYGLNCHFKLFITELFLAYMVLMFRFNPSVITSTLLMVIALAGVGGGFYLKQKSARICGLIFSLLVCGKIVLYDFRGGSSLQRIILFLVTGTIALLIGGIYIILEKKIREKQISQSMGGGE